MNGDNEKTCPNTITRRVSVPLDVTRKRKLKKCSVFKLTLIGNLSRSVND